MSALRKERIAKGLCPSCGKDAAPYYLCGDCRFKAKLVRILNRMAKAGALDKSRNGRETRWALGNWSGRISREDVDRIMDEMVWRPDPKEGDRRSRPRLGRVPVLVENELAKLVTHMGRPATLEEIIEAWAKLREKRRTSSAAGDLAKIIEAKRKRERKLQKRAEMLTRAA